MITMGRGVRQPFALTAHTVIVGGPWGQGITL